MSSTATTVARAVRRRSAVTPLCHHRHMDRPNKNSMRWHPAAGHDRDGRSGRSRRGGRPGDEAGDPPARRSGHDPTGRGGEAEEERTLMRCARSRRCRRSASSGHWPATTAFDIWASLLRRCWIALGGRSSSGAPPVSMPGWRSRIATPIDPPIRSGRCPEPDRSSSPRGRISPMASPRGPPARRRASLATPGATTTACCAPGWRSIAERLRRAGERALALADDNAIVDREVAYRAGLGWFGKNANLLVSGAGSWFVLGSVVTTADTRRRSRRHRSPTAAARATSASTTARRGRSSPRA